MTDLEAFFQPVGTDLLWEQAQGIDPRPGTGQLKPDAAANSLGALLARRDYGRLAAVLQAHLSSDQPDTSATDALLRATAELSLAAQVALSEVQYYERARAAAVERERGLHASLRKLLWLLEESGTRGDNGRAPATAMVPRNPEPAARPRLRVEASLLFTRLPEHPAVAGSPVAGSSVADPATASAAPAQAAPWLVVQMFGEFRVFFQQEQITEWKGNRSKLLLKYLLLHRDRPTPVEVLMDTFWRDEEPELARRSLYQAVYLLRQALQAAEGGGAWIISRHGAYGLDPALSVWLDSELFAQHVRTAVDLERRGSVSEAMAQYELAEALYQGDFLAEDIYEEWTSARRDGLRADYLQALDRLSAYSFAQQNWPLCLTYSQKMLQVEPCHEAAHRQLMRVYTARGQRHLALRQYHTCVERLDQELGVEPSPKTVQLYRQLCGA